SELDENNLFINRNLPDNVINILLLGVDTRNAELIEEDVKLADVQIILSLNTETGDVKLSSILRDTVVMNPFTGVRSPINYSLRSFDSKGKFHDDPQRAIATVNYNFEMNIQYYVMINFRGVAAIVDQLGGIDMELTEGEAANINYYLKKNAKSILKHYDTKEAKAARVELKVEDGVQHLDGLQALMYARLRQNKTKKKYNLGDDWQRTARTRNLLDKLLQKVLKGNTDIIDLVGFSVEYINSNMNPATMFDLIRTVLGGNIISKLGSGDSILEQFRIPMGNADDNTKTWSYVQEKGDLYGKIWLSKTNGNLQKNIEGLHEFIYGTYYPAGE
ncbi:MAG: LCP family protein, partial [Clostridia bacterium]|nr:LCP family protein [Clostridia bacterium]